MHGMFAFIFLAPGMTRARVRLCLCVLLARVCRYMGLSCYWASQLTPPLEQEEWLPKDHMLAEAVALNDKYACSAPFEAACMPTS